MGVSLVLSGIGKQRNMDRVGVVGPSRRKLARSRIPAMVSKVRRLAIGQIPGTQVSGKSQPRASDRFDITEPHVLIFCPEESYKSLLAKFERLKLPEDEEACTDGNGNVEVALYNITDKSAVDCKEAHGTSQIIAEWKTKLLDEYIVKPELLDPGVRVFDVTLKSYDSQTTLVWRLNLTIQPQDCAEKSGVALCSEKGTCVSDETKRSFTCQCCPNFGGSYCEESGGCHGNPCKNGGSCLDTTDGIKSNDYRCLCPHGYSGSSCEDKKSLCDHQPCLHNATCRENETVYWCHCPAGFTGRNCESKINECLSNPCVHGVCENGEESFTCYCLPGFGGDHCEFEYDECDSNPCINGGACEDLVAGYKCHCGPGYQGRRCQIKVNLCNPNPCPSPAQCVDKGNNYSCICNSIYNGAGCTQHYNPCFPNPCQNSGSCWPSLDTYFCSCRPGYTGNLCEVQVLYPSKSLGRTLEDAAGYKKDDTLVDSVNVPLDHLHNIYIAAATLAGACLIVVFVVTVCHCRVHKTYQRLFTGSLHGDMCSDAKRLRREDPDRFLLSLRGSVSNLRPCPDGVYEATTIDLSENLDRPLIDS
ncbi:fibropellin-1-like [Limulus polyphemus]|uniref:Fibropellin-1-like n=1 Tax=Limulus polyphemus TaxID=6850 RepID=A0ABM1T363_LIMPO|nr:fibropellin-1-like [Limulus polyphemus]